MLKCEVSCYDLNMDVDMVRHFCANFSPSRHRPGLNSNRCFTSNLDTERPHQAFLFFVGPTMKFLNLQFGTLIKVV